MNIIFKTLKAHNFMSFTDIEFDFSAFGGKVVLVNGRNEDIGGTDCRNGSGKTTLFNAMLFAIYGESLKPLKSISHVGNWSLPQNEDTIINLHIVVDGKEYVIERKLTGKRKSGSLRVWDSDDDFTHEITRSTMAETQKMIETDIVPCGKDGFLRCIFLTSDQNYNFFLLSKSAKNEFFESLFELTAYSTMYQKLHRDTIDNGNMLIASSRTIDQLTANIAKLERERAESEKNQTDILDAEEKVSESEKALAEFDADITVDENGSIVFNQDEEYEAIVAKGKALTERVNKGNALVKEIKDEIQKLRLEYSNSQYRINGILTSNKSMEKAIAAHSNVTDILCDDCLPKYKKAVSISDFSDRIESGLKEIEAIKKDSCGISEKIAEKEAVLKKYENGITAINDSINVLRSELANIKNKRAELQNRRNSLKSSVDTAKYRLKLLKETKTKSFDAPIRSLNDSLASTRAEYEELDCKIAHFKALEEILRPENIRKSVVADMLKELNFRICGYLSKMGSNYSCEFDEDFDAIFKSSNGREAEYNNFSAGERMRMGVACCLAFKDFMQVRLNINSNILILDEYIDANLDPMSVNGIMELIRYMVGTEKITAYIVSHRTEVLNSMSDVDILVTKKNDSSVLTITEKDGN